MEEEEGVYQISKSPLEPGVLGFMLKVASVNLTTVVLNVLPERWRFRLVENTTNVFTSVAHFLYTSSSREPDMQHFSINTYHQFPGVDSLIGSKGDPRGVSVFL